MKTIVILLIGLLCLGFGHKAQAQAMAELRQYTTGGKVDAEVVTIEPDRRWTAYGKTTLTVSGDKLVGSFWQLFSDRNRFAGDKDNTGIEINLNTGEITCILYTWGSGRDQYPASVQPGGKILVGRRGQAMLIVSLGQPKP